MLSTCYEFICGITLDNEPVTISQFVLANNETIAKMKLEQHFSRLDTPYLEYYETKPKQFYIIK